MTPAAIVRLVATACTGVLAGIYLGYRLGPHYALQAVDDATFIRFQQVVHVHYVTFMPPLVLSALGATLAWLVLARRARRSAEFWLIAASACAIAVIAGLTRAVSVPLNDQLMTWSADAPPPDLRAVWLPWERVNTVRAGLAILGVVLQGLALNLRVDTSGR